MGGPVLGTAPKIAIAMSLVSVGLFDPNRAHVAAVIGRFQIVPADYLIVLSASGRAQSTVTHGVFRINTETGETWLFDIVIDGQNKLHELWSKVPE